MVTGTREVAHQNIKAFTYLKIWNNTDFTSIFMFTVAIKTYVTYQIPTLKTRN